MIYDISAPISNQTPVWPGDPEVAVRRDADAEPPLVSTLGLGTHTATHVDPPAHFISGAPTVDQLPLDVLIGPAWVASISGNRPITAAALEQAGIPNPTTRLLLATPNSSRRTGQLAFDPEFVALAPDAAGWLLARGIRLVGIDGPSIEPFVAPGEPVHRALLAASVVIIEGLDLLGVPPGAYELVCLPLKLIGGDGAPARAVLIGHEGLANSRPW